MFLFLISKLVLFEKSKIDLSLFDPKKLNFKLLISKNG